IKATRYITSAQVNGKVYAIGGVDSNILSSIEEYDPDKNTWIKKATMPVGAVGSSAVSLNNEFYVIGGMTEQATTSGPATAQTNKYNPATDTWTRMPDISIARGLSSSVVLDGKIYVAGGSNNSTYYNTFEMLDLASTLPPVVQEPTPPPGTGEPAQPSNPTIPLGDRAILVVTMINGLEKEYDLPMSEIEAFTSWYDAKDAGKGPARFVIDKHSNNKGPFSKRTDSVIFNNILTFEVSEYTLK
ncbi:Kelch repeat-containing protein, partial [Saccharibacillus brassicae]|uniref:Kelch repeat-containing protein n=1 Tax=Saccharibacillus brassicae TaxID=2583377 RepID=UPI0039EA2A8E